MSKRKTNDEFIREAQLIHHNKYDYSKVEYANNKTKVCIICPDHGEFWQTPSDHLNGKGCPQCAGNVRCDKDTFIEKAKHIHNDRYDYSKVEYVNAHTKVCIICPEHGEFWQTPNNHLNGNGCPLCKNRKIGDVLRDTVEDFTKKSNEIHEITDCLKALLPQQWNRDIDVYIPSLKLGIEYNGLHWHSERLGKDKNYHLDKLNKCNEQGIKLIQIFEDEWINHREICESKLKQICGLNRNPKIFARKCKVVEIKSFADRRWTIDSTNNLYTKLGFEFDSYVPPTYWYYRDGEIMRHHKFGFRKQILHKRYGLPLDLKESEMAERLGYTRIWDCGLIKYVYKV